MARPPTVMAMKMTLLLPSLDPLKLAVLKLLRTLSIHPPTVFVTDPIATSDQGGGDGEGGGGGGGKW